MAQALDLSVLPRSREWQQLDLFEGICLFGGWDPRLLSWIEQKEGRFVVCLFDEDLPFLEAKMGPSGEHPRLRFYRYHLSQVETLKQIAWEWMFLEWGYFVVPGSDEAQARECFQALHAMHQGVDLLASELRDRGERFVTNVLSNMERLPAAKKGSSLEGSCKGMTAVICGAGASLDKVASHLAALQDKVVIIAGGSAILALEKQGVRPHILAALDPDPPYERFLSHSQFETPFFYQSRFSSDLLSRVHSPLIWMPSHSLVPLESYLLSECGLYEEPFDGGWTVANFCTALAAYLGFSEIVFAGLDFVAEQGKVYASSLSEQRHQEGWIELEKGIYSKKDWLMSADWTRNFVARHQGVTWGTLTTPPLDLLGVPPVSLESLLEREEGDLLGWVSRAEGTGVTKERVAQVRKDVGASFKRCEEHCQALLKLWERGYPNVPLEDAAYVLITHDLEQEICYEQCLKAVWEVWRWPILRQGDNAPAAQEIHRLLFLLDLLKLYARCV